MPSVDLRDTPLASVVAVAPVLTSAVQLRGSLWTQDADRHAEHLDRFLPTQYGREALLGVLRGTRAAAPARVHFLTGSYGTGKSYLLLVLASLLGLRLDDPRLDRLLGRIRKGEEVYGDGLAREIEQAKAFEEGGDKPGYGYLVVVPDYSDREYDRAILNALREALSGAGIDYRFPTEFAQAHRILDGWRADRPETVAALEAHLADEGSSVARLQREIEGHDGEALTRFGRLFEAVTGAPYQAPRVPLEETFHQTSTHLQKNGYRGIAVLFDEFGFFLSEAASGRAGTAVAAVQTFMEFARARPGADVVLVFAAHRALTDYGTGEAGQAEMRKMEGRLEATYRLRASAQFHEAEEMMAGAFVVPADGDSAAREAALARLRETAAEDDWTGRVSAWYGDAPAEWVQRTVVEGAYPLHPTVTLALPGLSDDVGQNTRTMFRFLAPGEPGGADAFIHGATVEQDGHLALLTIDRLFDYFAAPAEGGAGAAGRAGTALAEYRAARAVLRVADPLAERVLKTVAVIGLFGDPRLQATPPTLRWALHLPPEREDDLDALLGVLDAQGALRQNRNTKIYSFRSVGGTTTDALLAEKKRQIGTLAPDALRDLLRATRPPASYDPFAYNDRFQTNRRVAADYVVPGTEAAVLGAWVERFRRLYDKGDARGYEGNLVVLYGLYEDDAERARLTDTLRKDSELPTVIAAVAATPTPLADLALNVAAAEALLDDPKVRADENAVNEAALLIQQYRDALAAALDRALDPGQFTWFARGERRHEPDTLRPRSLGRFLDEAVEQVFPETPVVKSDVVQEYPSTNSTLHKRNRETAVDRLLQPVPFSIDGTSPVDAVLQGLLKPNDMFEQQELKGNEWYGTAVAPPDDTPAAAVWHALRERLLTAGSGRRVSKVPDVLPILYRPPFGLSWPAAEVVLGAFVAVHRDGFELRDKNDRQVPLSGEALLGAFRSSTPHRLVHQAITAAERALLGVVDEVLGRRRVPEVDRSLGLWADPAARLAEWYKALPDLTRKGAPAEDDDVRALFDALDDYKGKRDDQPARELLSEALPMAFGLDVLEDPDGLKGFGQRLDAALKAADRFVDDYAEAVLRDTAYAAFEETVSGSAEFEARLARWRDALPPAAKQHTYDGPADALLEVVTRSSTEGVVKRYLADLSLAWGMASYKAWKTKKQRTDYVTTFRDAVREVDAYRHSPLPLLRRLHRETFGDARPEPATEADVDAAFRDWLGALPDPTFARLEGGDFGPVATSLFSAIRGAGTVEDRYLGVVPQAISQTVGPWTSWPQVAQNNFVFGVAEAVEAVASWMPPLSVDGAAALVLDRLGWPAGDPSAASTEALDAAAAAWYDGLTPAARRHTFGGLADVVVGRLRDRSGLAGGLAESLPRAAGLPALHEARNAAAAEALADRLAEAVGGVEAWRRPVLDVLRLVAEPDGPALAEASAFSLQLGDWARGLRRSPTPDDLSGPASALLAWAQAGSQWRPAFAAFAQACGLAPDVHTWSPSDDAAFAEAVGAARAEIEAWTPPPADPVALRAAVSDALKGVVHTTGASPDEVRAVLFQAAVDLG